VARRSALVIATDSFVEAGFGHCPFAEAGTRALADALAVAGWNLPAEYRLFGPLATKAIIESRLRKLRKSIVKGEELIVVFSGRGLSTEGASYLLCRDTLAEDLAGTAVDFTAFTECLASSKAGRIAVLLDVASDPADRERAPFQLPEFEPGSKIAGLLSSSDGEPWLAAAELKSTAWMHLAIDGLLGRAAKNGRVSLASLGEYVERELPRVLRKHGEPGASQSAAAFGEALESFHLADVVVAPESPGLDFGRLRRVVLRAEATTRVKDLAGFRKSFQIPTNAGPSSRKFLARLAADEIRIGLDEVYAAVRDRFGYRRKDLDLHVDNDGSGFLKTPDFQYTVTASQDASDPASILWRREAGAFSNIAFARGDGFADVFGKVFDQIVLEFAEPVEVIALVDRLEDRPLPGTKVIVNAAGDACEVVLAGFAGRVTIDRHSLAVRGRPGDLAGLFERFLHFLQTVDGVAELPAIGPAPKTGPLTRARRKEQ